MAGPIYKLFMFKPTEAWYQLSPQEQQAIIAETQGIQRDLGGKTIIECFSGWSSEQWQYFGVEEYPSIEAVQALTAAHLKIGLYRYTEAMTLLGTEAPTSD